MLAKTYAKEKIEKLNVEFPLMTKRNLEVLLEGNYRFKEGLVDLKFCKVEREIFLNNEVPLAAVICCSDSRIVPEFIFNSGLGSIFSVRTVGNILDKSGIASLEFAVKELNVPLILSLGNSNCALADKIIEDLVYRDNNLLLELKNIETILKKVKEKAIQVFRFGGTRKDFIIAHTYDQLLTLYSKSNIIKTAIKNKKLALVCAFYDMKTGEVELHHAITYSNFKYPNS